MIETPFLNVNGEAVSLELALGIALMDDRYDIREQLASKFALRAWALDQNLAPTNEDLQSELNAFRQEVNLERRIDFEKWMSSNNVSEAAVRSVCEFRFLTNTLLTSISDTMIADAYHEIVPSLREASLFLLPFDTQSQAQSVAEDLRDDKIGFLEAIDQYCDEKTKVEGDFVNTFALSDFPKNQRDVVRALNPGEVAGPIEDDGRWLLIKLNATTVPALEEIADDLRAEIAAEIIARYTESIVVLRDAN